MGYILPVQNHQYVDYQKRIEEAKRKPHTIEKAYKVILENQYEEIEKDYEQSEGKKETPSESMVEPSFTNQPPLPGLGENFNKTV
ncbi:hypothetical protein [Ornithinibacillus halophilus]|uniref:Uncharacterized protein n=1 Tax=Ornithinibacillus halophilus TaxID=930117 RepID=A0A1M5IQI6_9BACI|nr:hypothetical protein [Ornithinibacillus halophilus]SHG30486.1 hypothetical protein SAMN05216225_102537 [Ornithinibacillus halophilus]